MELLLVGAVLLAIPPLQLIISVIGLIKSPKQWRFFCIGYIASIAMIAYSWIPLSTPDITRYFYMLERCASMTLNEINVFFDDGLFVKNYIFWLISRTGNVHLLPAISTGTVYGIASYITCSYCESEDKDQYIPIIMLFQFLSLPFFSITSNIRNVWCFALITLAAYRELYQKKNNAVTLCLYILPCFIHSGGWILIGIRLVCMIAKRFRFIAIIVAFGVASIIKYLYSIISYLPNKAVTNMVKVAHNYLFEKDSAYALSVASNIGDRLSRYAAMILAVLVVIYIFLKIKEQDNKATFNTYEYVVASAVIGFNAFTVPHYWRLSVAVTIGIAPVLSMMIDDFYAKRKHYCTFINMVFLMACIQLFLQVKTTSGLVNYTQLFTDSMLNSVYVLLFSSIKGLIG